MKAALMQAFAAPLDLVEVSEPLCPPGGVIVAVEACGLCRSDHHAWKGVDPDIVLPHVMGHEMAGRVLEVGPEVRGFSVGDRVTAPFILGCGACQDCRGGQPTICGQQEVMGFTAWGAFAERVAVPHADFNLVRLPDALGFVEAAGMGCRVTTAWRALTDRARIEPGEWLAVHGCGGVGLSAILLARVLGARVVAVDPRPEALAKARHLGAEVCLPVGPDLQTELHEVTRGGAHVSLDGLGKSLTFHQSLASLRPLGRHVQIGMPLGEDARVELPLLEAVYAKQIAILGTRGLGAAGFAPLLALIEGGQLDLSQLVETRIPLSQVSEELARMDRGELVGVTVIEALDR